MQLVHTGGRSRWKIETQGFNAFVAARRIQVRFATSWRQGCRAAGLFFVETQ